MTGTDDEPHAALRIGGWLPPANPAADPASDPAGDPAANSASDPAGGVEAIGSVPAAPALAPGGGHSQPAAPAPTPDPGARAVPGPRHTSRGEPAPRAPLRPGTERRWSGYGKPPGRGLRLGGGPPQQPRSRRIALAVAAIAAVAAAVPLTIGMIAGPAEPDRSVQPPQALLPTAPGTTPAVGTPTSVAASTTASTLASATVTPGTTRSAAESVPTGPDGTRPSSPRPPSTPPPPRVDLSLEAEGPSAVRAGTASIRSLAGASGGAVVTGIGNDPTSLVRFTDVVVSADGTYTVTFYYVGSAEQRRAAITVNGRRMTTLQFPGTPDDDTVRAASIQLALSSGANTIEFGNRNDWTPDLDRIAVTN